MFAILKPLIFGLEPEVAHNLAINSLKVNIIPKSFFKVKDEEILETKLFNKKLNNPIGMAAGFDKNAEVYNSLFNLGFGFVEVGTVTPKKQYGNPKPRIFRLQKDKALINRLGFNNEGVEKISSRILRRVPNGTLGINIGPNKDTKNKVEDFLVCLSKVHGQADYITINISSPNTEGLRDLHEKNSLSELLNKLNDLKEKKRIYKPLFVKISPDINDQEISQIIEIIIKYKIEGVIISNTSDNNRSALSDIQKNERGGLSGLPLKNISTELIKKFYKEVNGKVKIIGVGGVDTGRSVFEKIISGATAIQLYTSMIYRGPGIAKEIKKELVEILKKEKIKNITEAIGVNS